METHGGNIFIHEVQYDFSANLNPLGIPEQVRRAVMDASDLWEHYPDPDCTELVGKLAEYEHHEADGIVCGNGAADLIYRIVQAVRPQKAVLCAPAFSEYKKALSEQNCAITEYRLAAEDDFRLTEQFLEVLTPDTDILFVCNPNNPTGKCIPSALLGRIAEKCLHNHIILVCDECFLDFVCGAVSGKEYLHETMVVLKAFTKTYAMPGLRLGYALFGSAELADQVRKNGQYWSVSAPAQAAGLAALEETEYLDSAIRLITEERTFLQESLKELGVQFYTSDVNFILIRTAPGFKEKMLGQKILIRSCENYTGLDETFYRIAVRNHDENEALLAAFRRCLCG